MSKKLEYYMVSETAAMTINAAKSLQQLKYLFETRNKLSTVVCRMTALYQTFLWSNESVSNSSARKERLKNRIP